MNLNANSAFPLRWASLTKDNMKPTIWNTNTKASFHYGRISFKNWSMPEFVSFLNGWIFLMEIPFHPEDGNSWDPCRLPHEALNCLHRWQSNQEHLGSLSAWLPATSVFKLNNGMEEWFRNCLLLLQRIEIQFPAPKAGDSQLPAILPPGNLLPFSGL